MKKFVNVKAICATMLCFVIAITLCACKKPAPSSSEADSASQTSSLTSSVTPSSPSSTEEQPASSSESTATSPSSTEEPSVSSLDSSVTSTPSTAPDKTPSSSKTSTTTSTIPEPPKTPAQIIVGKWRGSVDMAPMFSEEGYHMDGEQMVSCDVEFTSGGVVYETIDRVSLQTVYVNFFTLWIDNMLSENNLTKGQFESSIGMTCDEYLNQLVQVAMESVPQTIIMAYKFEGEDLYVREQNDADFKKQEYSFSGENKLTMVEEGQAVTYTRIS